MKDWEFRRLQDLEADLHQAENGNEKIKFVKADIRFLIDILQPYKKEHIDENLQRRSKELQERSIKAHKL